MGWAIRLYTDGFSHPEQFHHRFGAHLVHDLATVHFDGHHASLDSHG